MSNHYVEKWVKCRHMSGLVLVVDDDPDFRQVTALYLQLAGYRALTAADGIEGLSAYKAHSPDLVILDILMPGMDGWIMCQQLRNLTEIPIMVLTGQGRERDRLRGFDLGVDDYMVKPISFPEMVARVGAILARYHGNKPSSSMPIVHGELRIDPVSHQVTRGGTPVHLTPTEFRLLLALAEQRGRPIAPENLVERVWGGEDPDSLDNLKSYIGYLRRKLEADPSHPRLILNQRGFGYLLAR